MKVMVMFMLEKYDDVLTVKDLQSILPLGKNSIYKLLRTKSIKSVRIGNKILIPKEFVIEYLMKSA